MIQLRDYQEESKDRLFEWWGEHPGQEEIPILWLPTAAGKSIICAAITQEAFSRWPEHHPRTLVIVPSKELAEQNAEKLRAVLPAHLSLGYYSAALGRRQGHADVIVGTIGSVAKHAAKLGNIKLVLIDECHLVNPDGAGMYREFLRDLARFCKFRVAGLTATPFRGNGIWLTDGKEPLFTGIAHEVPMRLLLERGFLSPLALPPRDLETISTDGIRSTGGDFNVSQLAERVDAYLAGVAVQAVELAKDRRKWIAFTPDVATAHKLAGLLKELGTPSAVVTGETPKQEREATIGRFRRGDSIRCLVSVLALTTGFDVPAVDCVIWCRPTKSPVLYVQGAGRGMRIAPGKKDCLWLDFSDTTRRLGPIDEIRGRSRRLGAVPGDAPFAICDFCGAQVRPASLLRCPECDQLMRIEVEAKARQVSDAPVMSDQRERIVNRYEVTEVVYARHEKEGRPPSMRVQYLAGFTRVAQEFVCFEHGGFAEARAYAWWAARAPGTPSSVDEALEWIGMGCPVKQPAAILVDETERFPEIVNYEWTDEDAQAEAAPA